jgi:sugar lactone lactonase YvrE
MAAATPVETPSPAAPLTEIALPGDANGLVWDAGTLYFADDSTSSLMSWTQQAGFSTVAKLPAEGSKVSFGGLVRQPDGSFVIASFGFGTDGGVIVVDAQHNATMVPNLDKTRRRVGIARAPDGTLYDVYFTVTGKDQDPAHTHKGGVAKLDLAKGETEINTPNLVKPVGIAAGAGVVYVADQGANTIYALRGGTSAPFASGLQSADLLTLLPDGSMVTGGKEGAVSKIGTDGRITIIAQGFDQVRGIAYDPDGKRLILADHSKERPHKLHIVALP